MADSSVLWSVRCGGLNVEDGECFDRVVRGTSSHAPWSVLGRFFVTTHTLVVFLLAVTLVCTWSILRDDTHLGRVFVGRWSASLRVCGARDDRVNCTESTGWMKTLPHTILCVAGYHSLLLIAGRVPDEGSGTGSDTERSVGMNRQMSIRVLGDDPMHLIYAINAFLKKQT